jgi:hypothetical protein
LDRVQQLEQQLQRQRDIVSCSHGLLTTPSFLARDTQVLHQA